MDSLRAALAGEILEYSLPAHPKNIPGRVSGTLVGGNLSVLFSLAGSDLEPDTAGSILFLEDVGEFLYHIDRMLMNLEIRNRLASLKGLIIGSFNDMKISGGGYRTPAYDIIRNFIATYGYPVLFGFPAGHEERNLSLYMGRETELDARQGRVRFL
jgi:muramoyltetrapeptide carboxypeptidase